MISGVHVKMMMHHSQLALDSVKYFLCLVFHHFYMDLPHK